MGRATEKEKQYAERHISAVHSLWKGVQPVNDRQLHFALQVALRDHASLVELLINKNLITREEYLQALAIGMETEAASRNHVLMTKLLSDGVQG
jgi:hypothetical protein